MNMTPKLYIDFTLEMLPKVSAKLEDAINEHKEELESSGSEEALKILLGIVIKLRQEIGKELLPEGITDEDMEKYKEEHKAEIDEYLAANPEVKEKLDKLQEEFQSKLKL